MEARQARTLDWLALARPGQGPGQHHRGLEYRRQNKMRIALHDSDRPSSDRTFGRASLRLCLLRTPSTVQPLASPRSGSS